MHWVSALALLMSGKVILAIVGGSVVGLLLGSLPGLGPVFVLTVLLAVSARFPTLVALTFLVAAYTSAVLGGAITAVVFNVPGHPGNIATTFDGPPMAESGRAGEAVVAIGLSGAVGGVLSAVTLIFGAPLIVDLALHLQPVDYFLLAVIALTMIVVFSRRHLVGGLLLGGIGFLIATVGSDPITGNDRFTFGSSFLQANGIPLSLIAVGLFAVGSGLVMIEQSAGRSEQLSRPVSLRAGMGRGIRAVVSHPVPVLRSSVVGIVLGLVPGMGVTVSNLAAYQLETRFKPDAPWGKGHVVGVMAPEAADAGTLISELMPAFALGIPGAVTSALMLDALLLHGLVPGPGFFNSGATVSAFLLAIPICQLVNAVLGIAVAPLVVRMARIPHAIVGPAVIVLGAVAAYVVNGSISDVAVAFAFGIVGYTILKLKLPLAPLALGALLGPLAEANFRRVQQISAANHGNAFLQPLPLVLAVVAAGALFGPGIFRLVDRTGRRRVRWGPTEEARAGDAGNVSHRNVISSSKPGGFGARAAADGGLAGASELPAALRATTTNRDEEDQG